MTINSNGNIGFGTTNPGGSLDIESSDDQTEVLINNTGFGDPTVRFQFSGTSQFTLGVDNSDSDKFKISGSSLLGFNDVLTIEPNNYYVGIGNTSPGHPLHMGSGAHVTAAGVWTDASDIAKKYHIDTMHYGLFEIMQLQPMTYNYKADDSESIGFIAQEMEKVIPEVVSGEEGEKGIAYGLLTSVLVKGMQEQQMIINSQQREIQELRSKLSEVDQLRSEIAEIKAMLTASVNNE